MFCTKCGKEIKPNNKFCIYCGEPVNNDEISIDGANEDIQPVDVNTANLFETAAPQEPEAYPDISYRQDNDAEYPIEKEKSGKGLSGVLIILIIVLAVLVVGGLGAGIYLYLSSNSDEKSIEQNDTEEISNGAQNSNASNDGENEEADQESQSDEDKDPKEVLSDDADKSDDKDDEGDSEEDSEDDGDNDTDYLRDDNFHEDDGIHSYEYIIDDVTWKQAYKDCISRGGYLAHINSVEEYEKILEDLNTEEYQKINFYIGARRDPDTEEYYWINTNGDYFGDVLNSPSLSQYWLEGEPSFEGEGEEELFMDMIYKQSDDKWFWNDVPNDIEALSDYFKGRIGYICEYE